MIGISIWLGGQFSPSLLAVLGIPAVQDLLLPPVSAKKMMQIPVHTAQMQDRSAMLLLARQKRARADALSASVQVGDLRSDAGPV